MLRAESRSSVYHTTRNPKKKKQVQIKDWTQACEEERLNHTKIKTGKIQTSQDNAHFVW